VREHLESAITGDCLHEVRARFLPFVRRVWPDFIHGRHHDVMADGCSMLYALLVRLHSWPP
jgi:hypothetical protein